MAAGGRGPPFSHSRKGIFIENYMASLLGYAALALQQKGGKK